MKKTLVILIILVLSKGAFAQVIKLQTGAVLSKLFWGNKELSEHSFFDEPIVSFSGYAGIEYFQKKHFNLSSNIGFIRKGGEFTFTPAPFVPDPAIPDGEIVNKAIADYLSLNTTIDFKFSIKDKLIPYLSIGPRIDYLVSFNNEFDGIEKMDELNKISFGLISGIGIKYCCLHQLQIGLKSDYFINFTKIAEWSADEPYNLGGEITDKTFLFSFTIGYALN